MSYRISGLAPELFAADFRENDKQLASRNARRVTASDSQGYPCRVSLQDAEAGETLLLLPYMHQPVAGPYQSSGPIFVREKAEKQAIFDNSVPLFLHRRLLSVRAYDVNGWMQEAEVVEGHILDRFIMKTFGQSHIEYLHLHNARPGCYSCRVDRA